MSILNKIFGDANEKYLKKTQPLVEKINYLEEKFESFSTEQLKEKTTEFKERFEKGEILDDLLPEAFALVREAAKRTLHQRHYDVQLIGGIALYQGKIAQMITGEGKTLAATLPLYLNALNGKGCHLVTVNDYLSRRDTVWMGQIYHLLGLSVGCLNHEQSFLYDPDYKRPDEEKDYYPPATLRPQPTHPKKDERDRARDELGSFYVVEDFLRPCSRKDAYMADITYGTNHEFGFDYLRDNMVYALSDRVQREFNFAIVDEIDFILIDEARTPLIISTPDAEADKMYAEFAQIIPHLKEEEDYNIDEKMRVVTLTEEGISKIEKILGMENIYVGKGIRYLHHLEQALRAQAINPSTGRPFFAKDHEYVVKNGKVIIVDEFTGRLMPGRRWSQGLHQAIEAKEGVEVQPESITLATISFQNYFRLYKKLAGMTGTAITSAEEFDKVYGLEVTCVPTNKPMIRKNLPDKVLKTEKGKLEVIVGEIKERNSKGQPILVGTRSVEKNEHLGKLLEREGIPHQILNAKNHEKEGQIIAQAGKLGAVTIATNMAGRGVDIILGGNPLNPEEAKKIIELGGLHVIGTERHEARRTCSSRMISKAIESAQSRIEGFHFDARSHLLEYDDVMNKHREAFYRRKKEILEKDEQGQLRDYILKIIQRQGYKIEDYEKKEKEVGFEKMRKIEKLICLRILDSLWIGHLENMDYLRDSVKLRAYGKRDPLVEYKNEGHRMFKKLFAMIDAAIANTIFRIEVVPPSQMRAQTQRREARQARPSRQKVGRNDPCPCGSGKKYKKCCWPKFG